MSGILDQLIVYHPAPWVDLDWARASGLPLEDVWFQAADGTRLFGWYAESSATPAVLLWCHGNAGNIINRLDNLAELYRLGFSVFLFDYRGYGRSRGRPSEEGLYQDALAAYAYLTETRRIRPERLVLFGRSLGAAVAGEVASQRPVAGLILESPFPSVEAMARAHYFGLPLHWLLGARFDLADRLQHISVPILVVHGDRDEVVPLQLGKQVFDVAREPKSFYLVHGADHNNLYLIGGQPYFQRLKRFAEEVIRG
ncbi:MAG: alpha/beta hydrolase [Nitrospirae bacterium]|nr:alpha/beta hydrolase [Nitrospirota bacterium]